MKLALVFLMIAFGVSIAPNDIIAVAFPHGRSVTAPPRPTSHVRLVLPTPKAVAADTAVLAGGASLLFHAAAVPADLVAAKRSQQEPPVTLAGIVGRGDRRSAMLRDKANGSVTLSGASSKIGDWQVMTVDQTCATLRRAKRSVQLCL